MICLFFFFFSGRQSPVEKFYTADLVLSPWCVNYFDSIFKSLFCDLSLILSMLWVHENLKYLLQNKVKSPSFTNFKLWFWMTLILKQSVSRFRDAVPKGLFLLTEDQMPSWSDLNMHKNFCYLTKWWAVQTPGLSYINYILVKFYPHISMYFKSHVFLRDDNYISLCSNLFISLLILRLNISVILERANLSNLEKC